VIAVSLRHFFPEHWDGTGDGYRMAQHVADMIAFIEQIEPRPIDLPIDLMGHSRGAHVAFRVAQQRPELLRRLVLAEPGGNLDASLASAPSASIARGTTAIADLIKAGHIDDGLRRFVDSIDGDGAWARLPAAAKQQLRDNATTMVGQVHEGREPYSKADAEAIRTPTLFIGGGDTKGNLAENHRALAPHVAGSRTAMIANASHWMFDQAPQEYCELVTRFLGG
jgi:pimeloyl-ACP methyl ester carboxylesterase